jgi:hypothetical protein
LRLLFLTLFLRGRSARGLRKETAPRSVGSKLAFTLFLYALLGVLALVFRRQSVFSLSIYLHAMTLMFLGMFVAASAGEVLFNKDEADILLHRPVTSRALLWAKIAVLVQVSLWLAGAFNLVGLFAGVGAVGGGWLYPIAHAVSTAAEALFCTGSVVMVYQLCLKWFGRERLDGLMTTAQVMMAVLAVVAGQIVPQAMMRLEGRLNISLDSWWIWFVPPAWFAGFDDALAGRGTPVCWALAACGLVVTTLVLWMAFGKLARNYEAGLQMLNEVVSSRPRQRVRGRWLKALIKLPPLRWCLKDSVTRASFLLVAAYLARDRDVKLRVYPSLAPMLVMPLIFVFQDRGQPGATFGIAFVASYLGLVALMSLNLLQYSQQWQAADIFRSAPMSGPIPLCHGSRLAVLFLLTAPLLVIYLGIFWVARINVLNLALLLPGLIALPVFALVPCVGGRAVPLSLPTEEAKSAGRGLTIVAVMMISMALSGLGMWAWSTGWFLWFLLIESIGAGAIYLTLRASLSSVRWRSAE